MRTHTYRVFNQSDSDPCDFTRDVTTFEAENFEDVQVQMSARDWAGWEGRLYLIVRVDGEGVTEHIAGKLVKYVKPRPKPQFVGVS